MRPLAFLLLLGAMPANALDISIANGEIVKSDAIPAAQIRLPDTAWSPKLTPKIVEGAIERQVFQVPGGTRTPTQLVSGLRSFLKDEGYNEDFSCSAGACGGFDFRFDLDILGEPDMHVDLGDFLYILLSRDPDQGDPHWVSIVASRTSEAGFIHLTTVSAIEESIDALPIEEAASAPTGPPTQLAEDNDIVLALTTNGRAVLGDLEFGSGSSTLAGGPYASLDALADWLIDNPTARIVLVGHTDAVGSLETNTRLSQARANSVANYLAEELGIDRSQMQSAGAGFLAPMASNLIEDGRAANRRVEAVLLSLDP